MLDALHVRFMEMVVAKATHHPSFNMKFGARVDELIEEDAVIRGIRYRFADGRHEVHAVRGAVVASNLIGPAVRARRLRAHHLAGVQRRREVPTPLMQVLQRNMRTQPPRPEGLSHGATLMRPPLLREIPALTAYGGLHSRD